MSPGVCSLRPFNSSGGILLGDMHNNDSHSLQDKLSSSDVALAANPPRPAKNHVWLKMDLFILPVATIIFFLSFLVRLRMGDAFQCV